MNGKQWTAARKGKAFGANLYAIQRLCSVFTWAVLARNAPLLDPLQVAELWDTTVPELNEWVSTMNDDQLAEFVVWLQDKQYLSELLVEEPVQRDYLHRDLMVDRKCVPLGFRMPLPESTGKKASGPVDAARMVLGFTRGKEGV